MRIHTFFTSLFLPLEMGIRDRNAKVKAIKSQLSQLKGDLKDSIDRLVLMWEEFEDQSREYTEAIEKENETVCILRSY